jgi:hypothetical protein
VVPVYQHCTIVSTKDAALHNIGAGFNITRFRLIKQLYDNPGNYIFGTVAAIDNSGDGFIF